MFIRSRLMTLSIMSAILLASGCLSNPATKSTTGDEATNNTVSGGLRTTKLANASITGLVELPKAQLSSDGTAFAKYQVQTVGSYTPCVGAVVSLRNELMEIAPNTDSKQKSDAKGKFTLKTVPANQNFFVVATFGGMTMATVTSVPTGKTGNVTINLATTLAAAGLLPLFLEVDQLHPAQAQFKNLSPTLFNNLAQAVESVLSDTTGTRPAKDLKSLTAAFNDLMKANPPIKTAYDAITGDLADKQSAGAGGSGGTGTSPKPSSGSSTDPSAQPSSGATDNPGASTPPSTQTFKDIVGALSAVAGVTIPGTANVQMLAVATPANLFIPTGTSVTVIDGTDTPTVLAAADLGLSFTGANTLARGGATSPVVYTVATSGGNLSLITINLLTKASTAKALTGLDAGANITALAFSDTTNKLYAADDQSNKVVTIDTTSGAVTGYINTSGAQGTGAANTDAATFGLNAPRGLLADGDKLYVSDFNNRRLVVADLTNNKVSPLVGSILGNVDGAYTDARFSSPTQLAKTDDGKLIVADTNISAVREVDLTAQGVISFTTADKPTDGSNVVKFPRGVAFFNGKMYAVDGDGKLQKFTPATN